MPPEQPIVTKQPPQNTNPFAKELSSHVNAGTVAIESERAIAEAQGKLVIAKRFPRDTARAYAAIIDACKRPGLAEEAVYSFPRGGQTISGSSIRLAETLAREWGNLDYGLRELSRKDGVSEMEAYCWDLETNVMSSQKFTVRHIRDTRQGGVKLTDERDIYELTANQGSRRVRARILAIIPPDVETAAVAQCRKTLAGENTEEPLIDRVRKIAVAFTKFGVTVALIEKRLGHALDAIIPEELTDLRSIHNSLRDNMSRVSDWFGDKEPEAEAEQQKRDPAPERAPSGVASSKAKAKKPDNIVEGDFVSQAKEPEKPKEPRTSLNAGEKITAVCTVLMVKTDMVKTVDGVSPTVIAEVEGEFKGKVYHLGGAEADNGTLTPQLAWIAGKSVTLALFGKPLAPKKNADGTTTPRPPAIMVESIKLNENVVPTSPAPQETGTELE